MTTTSLELSRQLQELFPGWKTELVWWLAEPDGDYTPTEYHVDTDFQGNGVRSLRQSFNRGKYVDDVLHAPTLDELRVFALELIGPEPDAYTLTSAGDERWEDWIDQMNGLKDALIQGCDPTAEFILKTFGGK